jgi:hypothetical protein
MRMLTKDIDRLADECESGPTPEKYKELESARDEFRRLLPPELLLPPDTLRY